MRWILAVQSLVKSGDSQDVITVQRVVRVASICVAIGIVTQPWADVNVPKSSNGQLLGSSDSRSLTEVVRGMVFLNDIVLGQEMATSKAFHTAYFPQVHLSVAQ